MKSIHRKYFSSLLISLAFISVFNAKISAQPKNIFFNNYSTKDGLSDNNVTAIVQDDDGYIWIGTKNGLNRFDGYQFRNYKKPIEGKNGLNNNYITRLFVDSKKRLWVITFSGVLQYDKLHDNFISYSHLFANKNMQATGIAEDAAHNLWLSTIGTGIYKINADLKSAENFMPADSTTTGYLNNKRNFISNLITKRNGNIWAASFDGLLQFNTTSKTFTAHHFKYADTLNRRYNNLFTNLYADPHNQNSTWCGTWGAGLLHFNIAEQSFTQFKYDHINPANLCNIVSLIQSATENQLWLCTEKGLMNFNTLEKSFETYTHIPEENNSFSGLSALCLFQGADKKLWIGSEQGFSLMNPAKQLFSYKTYSDIGNFVLFETDTLKNNLYFVSIYLNRSITVINNLTGEKKIIPLPQADEFNAEPFCMLTYNDSIFIGTNKGLYLFDKQTNKIQLLDIAVEFGINKNQLAVFDLVEGAAGTIYLACHNKNIGLLKLNVLNKKKWNAELVNLPSAIFSFNGINSFKKDDDGNIWMATNSSLCKMNSQTEQFEFFNSAENKKYSLLSGINDFTIDNKKNTWLTTEENGLLLFDSKYNLTAFNIFNGNPIERLSSICIDKKNNLWINGVQGLFQFNIATSSFRNFNSTDGLPPDMSQTNLQTEHDGKISFAYGNRIYSFNPDLEQTHAPDYSLKINSLKIFDKIYEGENEINFLEEIKLNHNQNFISFEFSAIDFSNASTIQYAYRLEGYDDDWNNSGRRRYASYTNLRPGNYKLHIKAGNEQGEWSKNEKVLSIIIAPAVWQTMWFKIFSLVLIATGIFFIVRYLSTIKLRKQIVQFEKQQAIEKVRAHISRDIHDEIGAGLTKISLMSRQLLKSETGNKIIVSKINEASGNLIQNLSEIVWTINPANDTLQNLIAYTRHYCGNFFDNTAINLHLDLPHINSIPPDLIVKPDLKRNYLFILKEACNNVLKHSAATNFYIELKLNNNSLKIKMSDDGKGFSMEDENKFGNGMRNMKKRVEEVKGFFEMKSEPQTGTIIQLTLPLS